MNTGIYVLISEEGWILKNGTSTWYNPDFPYEMYQSFEMVFDYIQVDKVIEKAKNEAWIIQPAYKQMVYINANNTLCLMGEKIPV